MKNTNWKDLVELVGLLAIVAGLAALVVELRQTQQAMLASTYQERAIDAIGELLIVADSDHLAAVLARTSRGEDHEAVDALDPVDLVRLRDYLRARMVDWDNEHYQYQQGYLDADFFKATTTRNVRKWAPRWRYIGLTEGRDEFRRYIDSVLADTTED